MIRSYWRLAGVAVALPVFLVACDISTPLQPVNHSPEVRALSVFPATIGLGDSAIVTCEATDADGDTVVYDWSSDCRMLKKGDNFGYLTLYNRLDHSLVVYATPCNRAPLDTGWVSCEVRDGRGGGAYAGTVRIVVRQ